MFVSLCLSMSLTNRRPLQRNFWAAVIYTLAVMRPLPFSIALAGLTPRSAKALLFWIMLPGAFLRSFPTTVHLDPSAVLSRGVQAIANALVPPGRFAAPVDAKADEEKSK